MVEFERGVVDQTIEEDMSLDIFEMTIKTNESTWNFWLLGITKC